MKLRQRLLRVFVLAGLAALLPTETSRAAFHLMMVVEVFPGYATNANAQFVELQMWTGGQNFVNQHSVLVFDAAGTQVASFKFLSDVANGADQARILIATTQAQTLFGVTADLTMTSPAIVAAGGKVCFDGSGDCVAWGNYSVGDQGAPFSPAGMVPGKSAHRRLDNAGSPTVLDFADDTNDSENDFLPGGPSPTNNAGESGTPPVLPAAYDSTPGAPGPIVFPSVTTGTTSQASFQIQEVGDATLVVSNPVLGGANSSEFAVVTAFPVTITDGGAPQTVQLTCTPAVNGSRSATLTLSTNDPVRPTVVYNLSCTGLPPPTPGYGSTPSAPGPIVFPTVTTGTTSPASFQIQEIGNATLVVSNPLLGGPQASEFAVVTAFPVTITDGGAARTVQLTCTPSVDGSRSATLTLSTNDPARPTVVYNLECAGVPPPTGLFFHSLEPCRVIDTRTGGGPIVAGVDRTFTMVGPPCDIPASAQAVSLNLAVTQPTSAGNVRLYPADAAVPTVSAINYSANQTRSNNAVVGLSPAGELKARAQPAGTVHLILDVNGYFDDGCPTPTQSCYSGPAGTENVGVCQAGTQTCSGGVFGPCVGETTPSAETCNGDDDDCNGTNDNGDPGAGGSCDSGLPGVCGPGIVTCSGAGGLVCTPGIQPGTQPETCNLLDDDCNGVVDDGCP